MIQNNLQTFRLRFGSSSVYNNRRKLKNSKWKDEEQFNHLNDLLEQRLREKNRRAPLLTQIRVAVTLRLIACFPL